MSVLQVDEEQVLFLQSEVSEVHPDFLVDLLNQVKMLEYVGEGIIVSHSQCLCLVITENDAFVHLSVLRVYWEEVNQLVEVTLVLRRRDYVRLPFDHFLSLNQCLNVREDYLEFEQNRHDFGLFGLLQPKHMVELLLNLVVNQLLFVHLVLHWGRLKNDVAGKLVDLLMRIIPHTRADIFWGSLGQTHCFIIKALDVELKFLELEVLFQTRLLESIDHGLEIKGVLNLGDEEEEEFPDMFLLLC